MMTAEMIDMTDDDDDNGDDDKGRGRGNDDSGIEG